MYIYIYIYTYSPSEGNEISKSPPAARDSHSFIQTIQTIAAFTSSTIQTADTPAAQATKERVLHPVIGGQSPIRPHTAEVGLKPMASASSQANCAVQANRKGHPCTMRKNRSTSPAGVLPSSGEPARDPGQWSFSSPGAHNGHPHRGPPSQGRSPPASADDGAATCDVLPLKVSRPSPCYFRGPSVHGRGDIYIYIYK